MKRKAIPLLKIGVFVLAGFVVLVVIVFYIGSKNQLFSSTSQLEARFVEVSGLKTGAMVRIAGMNIGSVSRISLPRKAGDSVAVEMQVRDEALGLIHTDSRALISTEGLIGDKLIVITPGRDDTPRLAVGAVMPGDSPKDYGRIADTLAAAVTQIDALAAEAAKILRSVNNGEGSLGKLVKDSALYKSIDGLVNDSRTSITASRVALERLSLGITDLTGEITISVQKVNNGTGTLGKLLNDTTLYSNFRTASDNVTLATMDMRDAMAKASLGTSRLAEVAEAAKHVFLIKNYFEDRGFWDATDLEQTIDRKLDSLHKLEHKLDLMKREAIPVKATPSK